MRQKLVNTEYHHLTSTMKWCWKVFSRYLVSCGLSSIIDGAKDSSYYPYPDFINPNIYYKMYWKDADNVLEDLDQFDTLYVKYHRCVWSSYRDLEGDSHDGGGDEDDYWYLGSQQEFRANIAYSLYGTLRDEKDRGCTKGTYINSFFTHSGFDTFTYTLGIDASDAYSYCSNGRNSGDKLIRRFLENENNGYSTGTGCSYQGAFVLDKFSGYQCNGAQYVETVDDLSSFNEQMEQIDCVQIYNSADYITSVEDDDNPNDEYDEDEDEEEAEREEDDDENDDPYQSSIAYNILSSSSACTYRMNRGKCPDPFGQMNTYEKNMHKAVNLAKRGEKWELPDTHRSLLSTLCLPLFMSGIVLTIYSLILFAHLKRLEMEALYSADLSSSENGDDVHDKKEKALPFLTKFGAVLYAFHSKVTTPKKTPESLYTVDSMPNFSMTEGETKRYNDVEKKLQNKLEIEMQRIKQKSDERLNDAKKNLSPSQIRIV